MFRAACNIHETRQSKFDLRLRITCCSAAQNSSNPSDGITATTVLESEQEGLCLLLVCYRYCFMFHVLYFCLKRNAQALVLLQFPLQHRHAELLHIRSNALKLPPHLAADSAALLHLVQQ